MTLLLPTESQQPVKSVRAPRRSRTEWLTHIHAWEHSGQTQTAYCRVQGLCYRQFVQWKKRLKNKAAVTPAMEEPAFVPVRVSSAMSDSSSDMIRITLPNRIEVSLPGRSDVPSVMSLLRQLVSLSC